MTDDHIDSQRLQRNGPSRTRCAFANMGQKSFLRGLTYLDSSGRMMQPKNVRQSP